MGQKKGAFPGLIASTALALGSVAMGPIGQAEAQSTPVSGTAGAADTNSAVGDIIVTARRRDETLVSSPVAVSVVSGADIARTGLTRMDNLAQSVPQLIVSDIGSGTQGGIVVIRGIGVGESNPFADQAVSFNVDGVQVSRATIRRIAELDVENIQVLKGPQALFFGKNSPAGIIVLRSKDPTQKFELGGTVGYEVVGREFRGDAYVSGPLTDTLGARLMIYGDSLNGYFHNNATANADVSTSSRIPQNHEIGGRFTLRYDPGSKFDARLKVNYGHVRGRGPDDSVQTIACPFGASQVAPTLDNCRADNQSVRADYPKSAVSADPLLSDKPFFHANLTLASLEANYRASDVLKITSITGYFGINQRQMTQIVSADSSTPQFLLGSGQKFSVDEYTEELRLASSFSGPFNFLLGAFGQKSDLDNSLVSVRPTTPVAILSPAQRHTQGGHSYSFFAQGSFNILPTLELSGGGRYSHETKKYDTFSLPSGTLVPTARPKRSWSDFSPEATIAWRPNQDRTIYFGYKHGFLSGGFNAGSGNQAADRSYDQQITKGFEGGIKARLFDRKLQTSLILYDYKTTGLQVSTNIVTTIGGIDQVVLNAGSARTKGVEFEANLRASRQLSLHGAIAYNHARYISFMGAPCYGGQSIAQGCNLARSAAGVFNAQDLSGKRLQRAPDWSLQGGFNYDIPVASNHMSLWSNVSYSSKYYGQLANKPDSLQSGYALIDAGISYAMAKSGVTLGIIGRNLTDKYYFYRSLDAVFTGSGTGTATTRASDTSGIINRGRQVMFQISYALPN